ncbi:MAG: HAMP domain-containing protein [Ignavibacteriae bacterium]|nr:HAMP domain-containing protein [Ignavibacteriota bacterium]NOG97681.1 HAMP domain-containing protein [Ignavibacteriota bacterium]
MNKSISNKIGATIASVLFVTITIMLVILLIKEENQIKNTTKSNVKEISELMTKTISFAMAEGTTEVDPLIEEANKSENISELRIIPTDIIEEGSSNNLDELEKIVESTREARFVNEEFEGVHVFRSVVPLPSNETCLDCHDSEIGDPLAIISIRYSTENTFAEISSQRWFAIIMGITVILIAIGVAVYVIKNKLLKDLFTTVSAIEKLGNGEICEQVEINRSDEIGQLVVTVNRLRENLCSKAQAANALAQGDLLNEVEVLSENDVLGISMNSVRKSLNELADGTKQLAKNAAIGNLKYRADENKHEGEYRKIIEGFNNTLDVAIKPIDEGTEVLAAMAEGDFTKRVKGEYKGDHQIIKNSINKVVDSLSIVLAEVNGVVDSTVASSSQIAESTREMGQGAREQATQTESVVSSINEMTATIQDSSQNASIASETARKAKDIAEEGGVVVEQTLSGIVHISEVVLSASEIVQKLGDNSDQIGEIIQVIRDIADQTNLLALNAAIEAARAGELGKGFAVVADEVRQLAERTTKATKEIGEMISAIQTDTKVAVDSMVLGAEEVEKGKELAEKAGYSLGSIIEVSSQVMDVINQVAAASEEQSSAVEQININIEQISEVTQNSAISVDEISHSADGLNELTANLNSLLRKFKINNKHEKIKSDVPDEVLC